jgi:hypothetical protein
MSFQDDKFVVGSVWDEALEALNSFLRWCGYA